MRNASLLVLALSLAAVAGCSREAPAAKSDSGESAEAFLKWSMDKHAAMPGFQAKATVTTARDEKVLPGKQQRQLFVQAPNQFKVVATAPGGERQTSVSDGKRIVEYQSVGDPAAKAYPAAASMGDSNAMFIRQPMIGASPLNQFFGGASAYDKLVNPVKGPAAFGADETAPGGEKARVVKFYGQHVYGNVEALIGRESGKVYRITYDLAELLDRYRKMGEAALAQTPPGAEKEALKKQIEAELPKSYRITELYEQVTHGAKLAANTFDTTPPKGIKLVDTVAAAMAEKDAASPIPINKPAPNFTVTRLDGTKVSLNSLKGKVVLVDFWATWCGPCKVGLPETEKLAQEGATKGLEVLAVSDESHQVVSDFMKENGYSMPTYLDEGQKMLKDYKVGGIPCIAIIDAKGILRSYLVGLYPPEQVREHLKRAGARI